MFKHRNLIGYRHPNQSRLTVLHYFYTDRHGCSVWVCECDCGVVLTVRAQNLTRGATRSCGCIVKDIIKSGAKLYTAFGETKILSEWVADPRCTVNVATFRNRLKMGWTVEKAIETPLRDKLDEDRRRLRRKTSEQEKQRRTQQKELRTRLMSTPLKDLLKQLV